MDGGGGGGGGHLPLASMGGHLPWPAYGWGEGTLALACIWMGREGGGGGTCGSLKTS